MTDPTEIDDALDAVADAFDHGRGEPRFEPGIDNSSDAGEGKVSVQKACRLIEASERALDGSDYYTSAVEHSFAAIERTLEGYLISVAGDDPELFTDHSTPYDRAKQQVPLEVSTVEQIEHFYDQRRASTYYGTSVATGQQAEALLHLARAVHMHTISFEPKLARFCNCPD